MVPKLIGLVAILGGAGFGAYKMLGDGAETGEIVAVVAMVIGIAFAIWGMFGPAKKDGNEKPA